MSCASSTRHSPVSGTTRTEQFRITSCRMHPPPLPRRRPQSVPATVQSPLPCSWSAPPSATSEGRAEATCAAASFPAPATRPTSHPVAAGHVGHHANPAVGRTPSTQVGSEDSGDSPTQVAELGRRGTLGRRGQPACASGVGGSGASSGAGGSLGSGVWAGRLARTFGWRGLHRLGRLGRRAVAPSARLGRLGGPALGRLGRRRQLDWLGWGGSGGV
ncbi:hypothetical protein EV138_6009 [Kribbella voronezhensis]|uniref:Uncharacterized protein n=1 Tax=Kribbella voronezhensis TaxID=2512212 RepID=A0A4R7SX39_9ACTN|nr:hypothetical protein EV138_6009 [Kribbella voronezhensis]